MFFKKKKNALQFESDFQQLCLKNKANLADEIKNLGFHYATKAGISISIEDLKVPPKKKNLIVIGNKEIVN